MEGDTGGGSTRRPKDITRSGDGGGAKPGRNSATKRPRQASGTNVDAGAAKGSETDSLEAEFDPLEYELRKGLPPRLPKRPNDVYVTKKTHFQAQLKRCQKLLDHPIKGDYNEIWIHGLGVAIDRALNLALQLKRQYCGSVDIEVHTDTVHLSDTLCPLLDDGQFRYNTRNCSAVHVRVFRSDVPVTDY